MFEHFTKYIQLLYGLIYLAASIVLILKARKAVTTPLKDILWGFAGFTIMKALSIFSGLATVFSPETMPLTNNTLPMETVFFIVLDTLHMEASVISNVFLLHFGISILSYKTSIRINYKVFAALLVLAFFVLHLTGIIPFDATEEISRKSFGFNGALLGCVGCLNLFYIKIQKKPGRKILFAGLAFCSIALLSFAFAEGIISEPVFEIPVIQLRLLSAVAILLSSFFITGLLKEEKGSRIGFV
ncbi:MAG TPA: hypothetical protein ENH40_01260 [Nitrospirae bacterium]|nr:hypothetical protein [Nitrospirota bacterium]